MVSDNNILAGRMPSRIAIVTLLIYLVLGGGASALSNDGGGTTDPTGDWFIGGNGNPATGYSYTDIVSAEARQLNSTHIQLKITVNGNIPSFGWQGYIWELDTDKNISTGGINPYLFNDIGWDYAIEIAGLSGPPYFLHQVRAYGVPQTVDGQMNGLPIPYEVNGNTISAVVSLASIGNPSSFYWIAGTTDGIQVNDKAPNSGHGTFSIPSLYPWTKYSGNPLNLENGADAPSVIFDGTNYKMWYALNGDIYYAYATSTDGITWTKYGKVLSKGASGSWEESSITPHTVIFDGSIYKMWYEGYSATSGRINIGYATSSDGITWTKYSNNPVLSPDDNGAWDNHHIHDASVIKDGSTYKMWYGGCCWPEKIGYATSSDGITWTKYSNNPVLSPGGNGGWDDKHVFHQTVLKDNTGYKMWYIGLDSSDIGRIGYATSPDGITWTKYSDNPVLNLGSGGAWDGANLNKPFVLFNGNSYNMWYGGYDGSIWRIGFASTSGFVPTPTTITVSPSLATVAVSKTLIFTATDQGGNPISVDWSSSDPTVGIVSPATGTSTNFTALKAGAATVRATKDGVVGSADVTVGSGLVAEYLFNGDAKDTSGNGNDGTINGGAAFVDGVSGQAMSFDGMDDYVIGSDSLFPSGNNPRTVLLWAKPIVDNNFHIAFAYGTYTSTQLSSIGIYRSTASWPSIANRWYISQHGDTVSGDVAQANVWTFLAFTFDGATYELYENAILTGSGSMATNTVLNRFYIGKDDGAYFKGIIDEVRIYNRALSAEEIKAEYDKLAPPTVTEIFVSPYRATITIGSTRTFTATDQDGNPISLDWSSSDESVGTIDSNGMFTAHKVGAATLTATSGEVVGSKDVYVILFDPDDEGYNFENWKFSEDEMGELKSYLELTLKSLNLGKVEEIPLKTLLYYSMTQPGHCYGMALTSILYFTDTIYRPSPYEDQKTYSITKAIAHPNIDSYHIRQISGWPKTNIIYWLGTYSAQSEFNMIKTSIQNGNPTILNIFDNKLDNGHAITAMGFDDRDENIKIVYAYDNEEIGSKNRIEFDISENRIYYPPTNYYYGFGEAPSAYMEDLTKDSISEAYKSLKTYLKMHNLKLILIDCPVNATITDQYGRNIGYSGGAFVNEIPNAISEIFNDVEIYYVPSDIDYQIKLTGFGVGNMDFSIIDGESTIVYEKIPITENTLGYTSSKSDYLDLNLELDHNGDGIIDETLRPTSYETNDKTTPTTSLSPTGIYGLNNWFTSDVHVTLTPSDEGGSGVATTEYTNDGVNWIPYTGTPFTISAEGATTIFYRSTDNAGNVEETRTQSISIDKTQPVITISGVTDGSYYNSDVTPVITIADINLDTQLTTLNGVPYTNGTAISAEGSYTLVTSAADKAGNNVSQTVSFVIDKTSPEAAIKFNVTSKDIKVYDSETGTEAGYIVLPSKKEKKEKKDDGESDDGESDDDDEKGWEQRKYTLNDSAANSLVLVLKHKNEGKEAQVKLVSAQYNGKAVINAVKNTIQAQYSEEKSGAIKELEQELKVEEFFDAEAKYSAKKGISELKVKLEGQKEKKETRAGIVILELLTDKGGLKLRY